jgi:mannose-6-phosphate isomerase-like protein (cupin superfamily)
MRIEHQNFMILSTEWFDKQDHFWDQHSFPDWAALSGLGYVISTAAGIGVEPHYHDCDEFWLFCTGIGEVWLDGQVHAIMPQTVVYTPMGLVHRFQSFTAGAMTAGFVTRLEGQKRSAHLHVAETGMPRSPFSGFVVPGDQNTGAFAPPEPRCPLSELRYRILLPGETAADGQARSHEYWIVTAGELQLVIEDVMFHLAPGDVAIVHGGLNRHVQTPAGAHIIVAREHVSVPQSAQV